MGNNCVHSKIYEDGIFYTISRSILSSRSPDIIPGPPRHQVHTTPPEPAKIEPTQKPQPMITMADQAHHVIMIVPPEPVKIKPAQEAKPMITVADQAERAQAQVCHVIMKVKEMPPEPVKIGPAQKANPVITTADQAKQAQVHHVIMGAKEMPPEPVKIELAREVKPVISVADQAGRVEARHVIMVVKEKPKPAKKKLSIGLEVDSVLRTKTGHLKRHFNLGEKLGHGQFGTTFRCVERETGRNYACKSIAKRKLVQADDLEDVRREIEIMHHLSGHPNVVQIQGAYEDAVAVHVVMELCKGGELFDRIAKKGHYSEKKAAVLTRTIVGVIENCHSLGVMHRDLKPENFLFVDDDEDSPMKIIDFGLSVFFKPGKILSDVVGSPYYVAPEVLRKRYGPEADVWSAGVIVYILLCGVPPFWGENEHEIFEEVLHGDIDFSSNPWPNISESAKDLVKKMLIRDPKRRISAHQVLCHPWVQEGGVAPDKPLDSAILSRMKHFSAMNKLKKMALRVIADNLCEEEIAGLREMFKTIDTDNSGYITFEELKNGLSRYGANLHESEIYDLMKAADIDNNGAIDYGEFIAATLNLNKIEKDDYLAKAFSYFDKDGSGYITQDELQKACQEFGIKDFRLEEVIQEVDQNNDGRIDYNEFVAMMHKGNRDLGKKKFKNGFGVEFREVMPVC